jgi:two-component system CheB/CheR fusion protein
MAFVLVQHLDPNHESMLTEILQKDTPIPVLEITDDIKVEPNHIYVIPSNKVMVATDGVLLLAPRPEKSKTERYLPIDIFFNSLAIVHQNHAIGVILSGTGTDGTLGLKAIKDYGGITLVQDEASAAYPDMPNNAVHADVVDFILSPDKMPEKLLEVTQIISSPIAVDQNLGVGNEDTFKQINEVLCIRKGTDFTYYKQTTIRRRILRRMAINKNAEPAEYLHYLIENKQEQDLLYQDLLIPVTAFFRDSTVFDTLCSTIFPLLLKNKRAGEPIRLWIAGCSTGEEAYSMAICIKQYLNSHSLMDAGTRVQLFATDLSERAIAKARSGVYTKMEVAGLSIERLNEFFTKTNGSYQVNRQIRDLCVFATHNFLKDPPFGKMDLVSCRNVLIYMEPYLQKKAFTTFHYALNPKGFLLLGKSETTSGVPDLFASAEKNGKLYTRKDFASRFIHEVSPRTKLNPIGTNNKPKTEKMRSDFQKTADDIMLSKYSPAGVVINADMDIVQFRGSTSRYLEQSSGKPSHNLLVLAKHGLAFELRNILHKTKKGAISVKKENVPVEINGSLANITIEAIPLPNTIEPHYLILFHDSNPIDSKQLPTESSKPTRKTKTDDKDLRIKQLELELTQVREDMCSITEDQEAANEELQSANEELLSGSEELQSLNEELETSKEELQSTNEELMVLNQEMIDLNEQIAAARNYSESIVANIREPLLVLDKNLRIKTANNSFYKTFRVNEKETEGIVLYDLGDKQWDIPELRTLLEKILPEKSIFHDFELTHSFKGIGELIMLLNAREVINKNTSEKLILLSIEDITERKKAQDALKQSESHFRHMSDLMPAKISNANADGNVTYFNKHWLDFSGYTFEELRDFGYHKIMHPDEVEEFQQLLQKAAETGNDLVMEMRFKNKQGNYIWHLNIATPIKDENGNLTIWIGVSTEIQHQKELREVLETAVLNRTTELQNANEKLVFESSEKEKRAEELVNINKELEAFAFVSSHDLQEPLRKIQTFTNRILTTEKLSDTGTNYFRLIEDAALRMRTLIDDLLSFSRLNTSERKFEITSLNIIVDTVKADFKEILDEKKGIIDATELCEAKIIAFQFRQLMQNLIGNALKFSKPNLPPHIIIKSRIIKGNKEKYHNLSPEKNYCHISVADNGIGFEEEYSEKIFEVFQRLHGKEEYAGTGIGLAIVKKIVDNHHGFINVTSQLNKGTTFNIYIPTD